MREAKVREGKAGWSRVWLWKQVRMRAFSGFTFRFYVLRLATWLLGQHFSILIMVYMSTIYVWTYITFDRRCRSRSCKVSRSSIAFGAVPWRERELRCLPACKWRDWLQAIVKADRMRIYKPIWTGRRGAYWSGTHWAVEVVKLACVCSTFSTHSQGDILCYTTI